jgi:glucose/arabinose dehydrogenase/PKD repeat protein
MRDGRAGLWAPALALALLAATTAATSAATPAPPATATAAAVAAVPPDFHVSTVFAGLNQPTNVEFAPDGRVFVAEKRGVIKVFDGPDDPTPAWLADLRTKVFNGWDRGLLGLAIAPDYATDPAVYVLYTLDRRPGGTVPTWGRPGQDVDNCPNPPGYTENGCVVMGRLSKLLLEGDRMWHGREKVLIEDWCQQYPSHSVGSLAFGPDGALYASGGDGASFGFVDYGQAGSPRNPCGDPPVPVGGRQTPPTAEGGALRSQDVRTVADATSPGGAIIRVDPDTGLPMPNNPLIAFPRNSTRRVVAFGFRNPFRFTLKPGTHALWVGDVGWDEIEEVNRTVGNDAAVDNFGWPCYEGRGRMPAWDNANLGLCESLYAQGTGAVRAPTFAYRHRRDITLGEPCDEQAGSAISGLAWTPATTPYPAAYRALFFADAFRQCIWRMPLTSAAQPDPARVALFGSGTGMVVDLQFGPGGELWYADLQGGMIRRIGYAAGNHPPEPVLRATPTSGDPPLTVTFDAGGSRDQDGDPLTFTWDTDRDGAFDDGTGPVIRQTYTAPAMVVVRVKVRDARGLVETATASVTVGTPTLPVPVITGPADGTLARVGTPLSFAGSATTATGATLPASALRWQANVLHCPDTCHSHTGVYAVSGVASGSFTVPDHEYASALELVLTATSGGQSASVTRRVDYRATDLTLASSPAGVRLTVGSTSGAAPFVSAQSTGGRVTLGAPATTTVGGVPYNFVSWSDGGAASHDVTVPATATTYTATYRPA